VAAKGNLKGKNAIYLKVEVDSDGAVKSLDRVEKRAKKLEKSIERRNKRAEKLEKKLAAQRRKAGGAISQQEKIEIVRSERERGRLVKKYRDGVDRSLMKHQMLSRAKMSRTAIYRNKSLGLAPDGLKSLQSETARLNSRFIEGQIHADKYRQSLKQLRTDALQSLRLQPTQKKTAVLKRTEESRKLTGVKQLESNERLAKKTLLSSSELLKLQAATAQLNKQYAIGAIAADRYHYELKKIRLEAKKTTFAGLIGDVKKATKAYKYHLVALAGVGGLGFFAVRVGAQFDSLRGAMMMASGSAQQSAEDFEFVRQEAMRLGADLNTAADGFVKIAVAAKGKTDATSIKELFTALSEFSVAQGQTAFRFDKSLQAISQMFSKGTINAEELRQQLAENMPGALQVFEKASGKSGEAFFKAMRDGQLKLQDMMPQVIKGFREAAREGGALSMQVNGIRVAIGRIQTAWASFLETFYAGGLKDLAKELLNLASNILRILTPLMSFIGGMMRPLAWILSIVNSILEQVGKITDNNVVKQFASWAGTLVGVLVTMKAIGAVWAFLTSSTLIARLLGFMKVMLNMLKQQLILEAIIAAFKNPVAAAAVGAMAAGAGIYAYRSMGGGTQGTSRGSTTVDNNVSVNPTLKVTIDGVAHAAKIAALNALEEKESSSARAIANGG